MLNKQRIGTFVLGGIAGVLAGVFFAPKSGKELRGSIASRTGEARERGRETYFEAQERMQERIAEARERDPRERSPRRRDTRVEGAADALPKLGPVAPEPVLGTELSSVGEPSEAPADIPPDPPPLRDVSRDEPPPVSGGEPEEIRRRIQETRARLQARLNAPESDEDVSEDRDG